MAASTLLEHLYKGVTARFMSVLSTVSQTQVIQHSRFAAHHRRYKTVYRSIRNDKKPDRRSDFRDSAPGRILAVYPHTTMSMRYVRDGRADIALRFLVYSNCLTEARFFATESIYATAHAVASTKHLQMDSAALADGMC